jgi:hypothetical protein
MRALDQARLTADEVTELETILTELGRLLIEIQRHLVELFLIV